MAALDWVFTAVMAASVLLGAWRGLVVEVVSVLSWIAAFVLAQWFAPVAGAWLPMGNTAEPLRYAAGFALVFIGTMFAGGLLGWLISKLLATVGLRPVDRTLGAAFGLVRGAVIAMVAAVVVHLTAQSGKEWWQESISAGVATAALRGLHPVLPESVRQYLPG